MASTSARSPSGSSYTSAPLHHQLDSSNGLEIKVTSSASISTLNDGGASALDYSPSSTILQGKAKRQQWAELVLPCVTSILPTSKPFITPKTSSPIPLATLIGGMNTDRTMGKSKDSTRDSTTRLKSLLSYLDEADEGVAVSKPKSPCRHILGSDDSDNDGEVQVS